MNISGGTTVIQEHDATRLTGAKSIDHTMGRSYTEERMKCTETFTFIAPVIKVSSRMESYFASADAIGLRVIKTGYSNIVEDPEIVISKVKAEWDIEDETVFRVYSRKPPIMSNVVTPLLKGIVDVDNKTKYAVFQFPKKIDHIKA